MKFLERKNVMLLSMLTTVIMFVIVMFIVNPMIDGANGLNVIALQLAFDKEIGIDIVSNWDREAFKQWIWTDYLYALSYMLFFASLLSWLMKSKGMEKNSWYHMMITITLLAGLFDWIENSLELWFLYDIDAFSSSIFFVHSSISMLKWLALPVIVMSIILLFKKDS